MMTLLKCVLLAITAPVLYFSFLLLNTIALLYSDLRSFEGAITLHVLVLDFGSARAAYNMVLMYCKIAIDLFKSTVT